MQYLENRALAYMMIHEYHKAIADYLLCDYWVPDNPDVIYFLGLCYAAIGLKNEAIDCMNRGISLSPDSASRAQFETLIRIYANRQKEMMKQTDEN